MKVNVEGKDGKEEIRTICSGISTNNGIWFIADMCRVFFLAALGPVTVGSVEDF